MAQLIRKPFPSMLMVDVIMPLDGHMGLDF